MSTSFGAPSDGSDGLGRLHGRRHGHRLRPRQLRLLQQTLPRLRFPFGSAHDPGAAFERRPAALRFEIGFGGGEHAQAIAEAWPDDGLIAAEIFANGICSLLSRLQPEGSEATAPLPPNLRLWNEDARILLRALPDHSLETVFLMFPDPWPKTRHAKRRFVGPANAALLHRLLRPGGEWRIASDDPTYQGWVRAALIALQGFELDTETAERPAGWPPTRYEAKALRAGRHPVYWSFRAVGFSG